MRIRERSDSSNQSPRSPQPLGQDLVCAQFPPLGPDRDGLLPCEVGSTDVTWDERIPHFGAYEIIKPLNFGAWRLDLGI